MVRIGLMAALVTAKTIVGGEEFHPAEQLYEVIEVAAIFFAGVHAAHKKPKHKKKEAHG